MGADLKRWCEMDSNSSMTPEKTGRAPQRVSERAMADALGQLMGISSSTVRSWLRRGDAMERMVGMTLLRDGERHRG